MIAALPKVPQLTVATEGHKPNLALASRASVDARVARPDSGGPARASAGEQLLRAGYEPPPDRHLVGRDRPRASSRWDLPLTAGGARQPPRAQRAHDGTTSRGSKRDPEVARAAAEKAGLIVTDLRHERPRTVFYDIGAVVYFLRLVVWIVPDFTVERYREELFALHCRIEREGGFETSASRFLIEAVKAMTLCTLGRRSPVWRLRWPAA